MYLIKGQNYSLSGVSAICDEDNTLHLEFAVSHRLRKYQANHIQLTLDKDLNLATVPSTLMSPSVYSIDICLSALCRYSAYCPEAKPRLLALWDKLIGSYADYKLRDLDQLGYLLCAIAHPQLADFKQEPFTFMLLCEAIIKPTSFCHFKQLVSLKRPDILRVCLLSWCRATYPLFDEAEFPQQISKSFYRFCQRLVPHVSLGSAQQLGINIRAVESLIRIAREPQLIDKLEHMPLISVNKLISLELRYIRLPYSQWLKLAESEAAAFADNHSENRLIEDIDGMAKELGASLKNLLKSVATVGEIRNLHDRLVAKVNERHRQMHLAQLTDSHLHITDKMGDAPFPACPLFIPAGIKHLNTPNLLRQEGMENSHCVGGRHYIERSRARQIYIFHIEHLGQHATLEIDANSFKVLQLKGFNNSRPTSALSNYVLNWLESEKQRLQLMNKAAR